MFKKSSRNINQILLKIIVHNKVYATDNYLFIKYPLLVNAGHKKVFMKML